MEQLTQSEQIKTGIPLNVLDHGYVKLIDSMGNDENIVEAARMSTDRGFISWEPYARCDKCQTILPLKEGEALPAGNCPPDWEPLTAHKWVNFHDGDLGMLDRLWRKKHATPFEMGELVVEVQAPIFVLREWHRHRTQSYNEFSARYSVMPNLHYLPEKSRIQKQSQTNKQGSAEPFEDSEAESIRDEFDEEQQEIFSRYEGMVNDGVAKEIARLNTPVSRYSKMRAKGNIRNWFQFLNLRMRPDAQMEIRQYANMVAVILHAIWPKAYRLFEEYDLYGTHLSRTELHVLREVFIRDWRPGYDLKELGSGDYKLSGTKLKEFLEKINLGGTRILS